MTCSARNEIVPYFTNTVYITLLLTENYMMLPKVHVNIRSLESLCKSGPLPKQIGDNHKRRGTRIWGNGRDWNIAKPREGGWVRIWPLAIGAPEEENTSGSIKAMVHSVSKFTKKAKELVKRHPAASESQLSEFLQEELDINGDIWMPPI